jgi:DNA repair protein RecN (Recombination protein N)
MLDAFGKLEGIVAKFSADYQTWRAGLREAEELAGAGRLSPDEIEFTRLQISRIDELDPTPESLAALERDFNRQSKAQELAELATELERDLASEEGIAAKFPPLVRAARKLAELDPAVLPLAQRLETAIVELQDVGGDFGRLIAELEFDEKTAQTIQDRMSRWLELQRRYGADPAAIRSKREELARKVAAQADIEGTLAKLAAESATREKALRREAAKLRTARAEAAATLEKKAAKLLKGLGFKQAGLEITVTATPDLHEHGDSRVEILFAPNPGQAALPLNKIASSGETARLMLALKAVLADADATPLLVFDEVDANVGGEIGAEVGRELAALGARHQVLCVTHLPQVAARATRHFVVEKNQTARATNIILRELQADPAARVDELARMLGDRSAKSAQQHARALLEVG